MQKSTLLALIYALFPLLLCTDLALFTFARDWHLRMVVGEDRAIEWLTFSFFSARFWPPWLWSATTPPA